MVLFKETPAPALPPPAAEFAAFAVASLSEMELRLMEWFILYTMALLCSILSSCCAVLGDEIMAAASPSENGEGPAAAAAAMGDPAEIAENVACESDV